jgi:hypothetical protein
LNYFYRALNGIHAQQWGHSTVNNRVLDSGSQVGAKCEAKAPCSIYKYITEKLIACFCRKNSLPLVVALDDMLRVSGKSWQMVPNLTFPIFNIS